jgi:branched-chain amino acid transport system ATP-binding protein
MLSFANVSAGYGGVPVLRDIGFSVADGEMVAIFGHNGAGKTTLMRCAVGDMAEVSGDITWRGEAIAPKAVFRNVRLGIGFVPQGHNVFRELTVRRNLLIAGLHHPEVDVEEIYRLFPILKSRGAQMAGSLSGGQQQILALGMALMTRPGILLLDEPTTGLAPVIVRDVMDSLVRINRETGTTVVIVEQYIPATLKITPRAMVLKSGRLVFDGASRELERKEDLWAWF